MHGNIVFGDVIQVMGANVAHTIDRRQSRFAVDEFPLDTEELPADLARTTPSRLLVSRFQIVPFTGRDTEQRDITTWLTDTAPTAARLIWGPGGQGKSRLAEHAARDAASRGWSIWRIRNETPAEPSTVAASTVGTLVLIDYADRWPNTELLTALTTFEALARATKTPVRILVLARAAGHWWHALAHALEDRIGIQPSAAYLTPIAEHEDDRLRHYRTALRAFAEAMHIDNPDSLDAAQHPPLNQPTYAAVLPLHMAALVAVDAHYRGGRPPREPYALSAYLLRREHARWFDLHTRAGNPIATRPEVMGRVVYTATLTGPMSRAHARPALAHLALAQTVPDADHVIDDHRYCYPPEDPRLVFESLRPDRLGEDMIALSTPGHPHAADRDAFAADDGTLDLAALLLDHPTHAQHWAPSILTVLVETSHRWPHVADTVLFPILRNNPQLAVDAGGNTLVRLAEIPNPDTAVLDAVSNSLPQAQNIEFDSANAAFATTLAPTRLAAATNDADRAQVYARLARSLYNVGRYQDALDAEQHAVDIYRELGDDHRKAFAAVLNNLGSRLRALGRRDEALAATYEALDISRELASQPSAGRSPREHFGELTESLNNLCNLLAEDGQLAESLAPIEEHLSIVRPLAHQDDYFSAALAVGLNNAGNRLTELGRRSEGLAYMTESNQIFAELAQRQPMTYRQRYAMSLSNLGLWRGEAGQLDEALTPAIEAVRIYRDLVTQNPGRYRSELAMALHNLSIRYAATGNLADSLTCAEEATALYRDLADQTPMAYGLTVAIALNNLALRRSAAGDDAGGEHVAAEAVEVLRELASTKPAVAKPHLAMALKSWSDRLAARNHNSAAITACDEAVTINRRLYADNPAYGDRLGGTLLSLSNHLAANGEPTRALAASKEAAETFDALVATDPDAYALGHATAGINYGLRLLDARKHRTAKTTLDQSLDRFAQLFKQSADSYRRFYAEALSQYADHCIKHDCWYEDGLANAVRAQELYSMLAQTDSRAFGETLTACRALTDELSRRAAGASPHGDQRP